MAARRTKDATELQPGDRAVIRPGKVERVRAPSTRGDYGTVTVHTDDSDVLTTLPCPVQIESGR